MDTEENQKAFDEMLRNLTEALTDVQHIWYQIGVQLGVSTTHLDKIEQQFQKEFGRALIAMIKRWLQNKEVLPGSNIHLWAEVVRILKLSSIDENKLAISIERKYPIQQRPTAAPQRSVSEPYDMKNKHETSSSGPMSECNDTKNQPNITPHHDKVSECGRDSEQSSETSDSGIFSGTAYKYLDVKHLTKNEEMMLKGRLTNEYKSITGKYSTLCREIRTSLKSRGITPKQLADVLMHLSAFVVKRQCHKQDTEMSLLEDCLDDIENAEDIQKVFRVISPYESFFDCHVIEHIVNSDLCTEDDKHKMSEYMRELEEYCKRNIYECPHISSPNPNSTVLAIKVDDLVTSRFTMKALGAFCAKIAQALNLERHTLIVCSVKDGCLQLTCQIPPFVKEHICSPRLTHWQKERLRSLNVQKITCDDDLLFIAYSPRPDLGAQLSLEGSSQEKYQTEQEGNMSGRLGIGRCCYIHQDGTTQRQGLLEFQDQRSESTSGRKLHTIKVRLPADQEVYRLQGQLCVLDSYSPIEESGSNKGPEQQQSLYDVRENQERALSRPLRTFLMTSYITDIEKKLLESLRRMHQHGLTPKLEGRFGELCWRKVSGEVQSRDEMYTPEEFSKQAFESTSSYFYTRIGKKSKDALSKSLSTSGGPLDEIETYDFKLRTGNGKVDIRVKFDDENKPQVLAVKKAEYKLAIFDILCLNRQYDMRVSLNNYEATSTDSPIVEAFISTLFMTKERTISFASKALDNSWRVALIRHKEIKTYTYQHPQFVVSVSTVRQFEVDTESNTSAIVDIDSKDAHTEIELHNLAWDVSFGHMLGFTPEKSLILYMKPEKISCLTKEVIESVPTKWTPEWVMEDFTKGEFVKMMENLNKEMDV